MGLFDLPAPLLSALDSVISGLPDYPRLLIWAALTAILSMIFYWLCSAQDKTGQAKQRAIDARKAMASYEGHEFGEMWPLARESLGASLKHFGIVLGPAVLSSLPALAIIVWVSNEFGYVLPKPGETVDTYTIPAAEIAGLPVSSEAETPVYRATYPAAGTSLMLSTANGEDLTELPLKGPVPVVHKQVWWNSLIGNPNGYLPDSHTTDAIYFELRSQQFLKFGPGWIRGWEFSYFVLLILVSLGIKVAFKIH